MAARIVTGFSRAPGVVRARAFLSESRRALAIRRRANVAGPYRFRLADAILHACERTWRTPAMTVVDGGGLQVVDIRGTRVYWPGSWSAADLPWLWMETFAPQWRNPASYDPVGTPYSHFDWVIDAGACEGFFSIRALGWRARHVIAVEPVPELAGALFKTLETPIAAGRAEVLSAALGASLGRATLAIDTDHACEAGLTARRGLDERDVAVTTLDELRRDRGLVGTGLVKLDVEGAEMDVLEGGRQCLRESSPALAVAVYHDVDNARRCRDIVVSANPAYRTWFRGMWAWQGVPRPYMMFAHATHREQGSPGRRAQFRSGATRHGGAG